MKKGKKLQEKLRTEALVFLEELLNRMTLGNYNIIKKNYKSTRKLYEKFQKYNMAYVNLLKEAMELEPHWGFASDGVIEIKLSGNNKRFDKSEKVSLSRQDNGEWDINLPFPRDELLVQISQKAKKALKKLPTKGDHSKLTQKVLKQLTRLKASRRTKYVKPPGFDMKEWKDLPNPLKDILSLRWPSKVLYTTDNLEDDELYEDFDEIQLAGVDFNTLDKWIIDPENFDLRGCDDEKLIFFAQDGHDELLLLDAKEPNPQDPIVYHILHHDPGQTPTKLGAYSAVLKMLKPEK